MRISYKFVGLSFSLALSSISLASTKPAFAHKPAVTAVSFNNYYYGDPQPDAPDLAPRGTYGVGVRTITLVNPGQLDIAHAAADGKVPVYDRPVKLEVWYPAIIPSGKVEETTYIDCLSPRPNAPPPAVYSFRGRALRGAAPDNSHGPYPLIVVSHGYPGSRLMMSYLTENLASKGYVVAAIDHADSTHFDKGPFTSTLVNRWSDIEFVLDQFQKAQSPGATPTALSSVEAIADVNNAALIGYSMGGFGVLNVAGAGYSAALNTLAGNHLSGRLDTSVGFAPDPRVKAVVGFAPWGEATGAWNATGLLGLHEPLLLVDGDHDDVAGYENGVRAIFNGAQNANRYLLVYENARHNIAPNPSPQLPGLDPRAFLGYGEPAWDSNRINNVNQHFVTAFLDTFLGKADESAYLNLPAKPGTHDWRGFYPRTAVGLELWHLDAGTKPVDAPIPPSNPH